MSILSELIKQAPATVAIIVTVVYFLRHLSQEADRRDSADKRREAIENRKIESIKQMGDSCHSFQTASSTRTEAMVARVQQSLDRNTEIMGRTGEVLDRLESYLDSRDEKESADRSDRVLRERQAMDRYSGQPPQPPQHPQAPNQKRGT